MFTVALKNAVSCGERERLSCSGCSLSCEASVDATNRDVHVENSLIFAPFRLVIKAGPVCVCVCSPHLSNQTSPVIAGCFCAVSTALLHWMRCSRVSLHSSGPENNEGVCCINLCNGEHEEGWWGWGCSGAGGETRRGEG